MASCILYAPGQHLRLSINAVLLVDLVDSSPSSPMLLLWLLPRRLQVCQGSKISSSAGQVKTTRGPTPTPTVEPTVQSTETVCVGRHRLKNWKHCFRNSPPRPLFVFSIVGPKQNAGSLLTHVSDSVFIALSHGTLGFALNGSFNNHLFQRIWLAVEEFQPIRKWLKKMPWRAKPIVPCERA